MSASIKLEGVKSLERMLKDFPKRLDGNVNDAIDLAAEVTLSVMKANTPVDTSNLKDSEGIERKRIGLFSRKTIEAFIGPQVIHPAIYAPFVEFGFTHYLSGQFIQGQHYVERTAIEVGPLVNQIIKRAVARTVRR